MSGSGCGGGLTWKYACLSASFAAGRCDGLYLRPAAMLPPVARTALPVTMVHEPDAAKLQGA